MYGSHWLTNASECGAKDGLALAASDVVKRLLGSNVRSSERVHRGMMTFKCRVQTVLGEDVMVRFYPKGRSAVVNQEPDLLSRCRVLGIPAPETIADSRTGPPAPLDYMVYFRIEGHTLSDSLPTLNEIQRKKLAKDLVFHVGQMQKVIFEGSGELSSGRRAEAKSWTSFVQRSMRSGLNAIRENYLLEVSQINALERVLCAGPPDLVQVTDRLVWGDINFDNVLVSTLGAVVGFIDFEGCLSGDPLATIGYCQAIHGDNVFFQTVLEAFPETRSKRASWLAWYALLRALRLARYAHLPLPTGRPRDPLKSIFPGMIAAIALLDPENNSL